MLTPNTAELRGGSVNLCDSNGCCALWWREGGLPANMFGRKKRQIGRVLLVEDEPLVAFDNEHLLSDAGFEVVATVDRVAAAIAAIAAARESGAGVDLVLADIRLADGSGLDVARAAREAGVPVLFVTGARPVDGEALAEGWLAKPYAPRDLVAAIRAVEARMEGKTVRRPPPGLQLFGEGAVTSG